MSVELGHFALTLAFALAVVQSVSGLGFWRRGGTGLNGFVAQAAIMQFLLVAMAFVALIQAFIVSDFSLKIVFENSHSLQPLIYKITSVWGNHEGSVLLWVLILVLFGAAIALFGRRLPTELQTLVLATQGVADHGPTKLRSCRS